METIIVQPATKSEQELLTRLFKKMGVKSRVISAEQKESMGLGMLMKDVDRTKKVSRKSVMQKLGR